MCGRIWRHRAQMPAKSPQRARASWHCQRPAVARTHTHRQCDDTSKCHRKWPVWPSSSFISFLSRSHLVGRRSPTDWAKFVRRLLGRRERCRLSSQAAAGGATWRRAGRKNANGPRALWRPADQISVLPSVFDARISINLNLIGPVGAETPRLKGPSVRPAGQVSP